jgi:predicted esterase
MIDEEAKNLGGDYSKIIIGGEAEGCVLAYYVFLLCRHALGGVAAFNGMPAIIYEHLFTNKNKQVPILAYHGKNNRIVPEDYHRSRVDFLKEAGFDVTYISEEGVTDYITDTTFKEMGKLFERIMKK